MNEPKMNQSDYQDLLSLFRQKFASMEQSQSDVKAKAEEFVAAIVSDPIITNDLIQLWAQKCRERGKHQLPLLLLANELIQGSYYAKTELHETFWGYVCSVFPSLYKSLNIALRNQIEKIIAAWEESAIYSPEKLKELRFLMKFETLPEIKGGPVESGLLYQLITSNRLKIDEKLVEFTKAIDALNRTGENKQREKVLKVSSEIIEKQNKVFFQHIYFLMETDKMLDKIQAYKAMNSNFEGDNNNVNTNQPIN